MSFTFLKPQPSSSPRTTAGKGPRGSAISRHSHESQRHSDNMSNNNQREGKNMEMLESKNKGNFIQNPLTIQPPPPPPPNNKGTIPITGTPSTSRQFVSSLSSLTNDPVPHHPRSTIQPQQSSFTDEIIFDSITPNFDVKVFFVQLFSHVFIFLAPFLSPNPLVNRFYGGTPLAFFYNTLLPILVYIVFFSYLFCSGENSNVLSGAFFLPVIYFVQHKLIVAVKYASLSNTEYYRIMHCENDKLIDLYHSQLQLISGWLNRDDTIIEFELNAASVRIGTKISTVYFIIPNPTTAMNQEASKLSQFRHWIALLRGLRYIDISAQPTDELELIEKKRSPSSPPIPTSVLPPSRSRQNSEVPNNYRNESYYRISVNDLCLTLIRRCDERSTEGNTSFYYGTYIYNIINLLIPFVLLMGQPDSIDYRDPYLYIFLISSTIINILFGLVVYNLLYVSIFDATRQLTIFRDLSRLARLNDLELQKSDLTSSQSMENNDEMMKQRLFNAKQTTSSLMKLNRKEMKDDRETMMKQQLLHQQEQQRQEIKLKKFARKSSESSDAEDSLEEKEAAAAVAILKKENGKEFQEEGDDNDDSMMLDGRGMSVILNDNFNCAGERIADENTFAEIPRLDFEYVENVIAWTYARLIFQNFGDRYRYRMDIYVGGTMIIMVLLVFGALIRVILLKDRVDAFMNCFFLQSIAGITFVFIFLIFISTVSALINNEMEVHNQLFSRQILRLRNNLYAQRQRGGGALYEERKEKIEMIVEQLESSLGIFEKENQLKPFSIFGVAASDSLTLTIASGIGSFYFALIGLFTANSAAAQGLMQF